MLKMREQNYKFHVNTIVIYTWKLSSDVNSVRCLLAVTLSIIISKFKFEIFKIQNLKFEIWNVELGYCH